MGTEKSRKVGLSCRRAQRPHPATLGFVPAPGAAAFGGQPQKGPVLAPGWPVSRGCHRDPPSPLLPPPLLPPSAAALAEGAALKAGIPVPRSRRGGEGGGGSQAGGPGRDGGTQLALPCCCGGDHGSRGPPAEGWGGGQNPAGMGTPMGTSPRHGCWGLGARGALWDGGWQAARIKARQPSAGFGSGCAVCAQARTGAISGGGWVASRCPHMAAAPLM